MWGISSSTDGTGVHGVASNLSGSATGVTGDSWARDGIGVRGRALGDAGVGGQFERSEEPGSLGLKVLGRAEFSTCGIANVGSGASSVVVTPGVEVTSNSKMLATLQGPAGGTTAVRYAARDTSGDTFTIHLTAAATQDVPVAWFVIG